MGLDVYLYHYTSNRDEILSREAAYNTRSEEIWGRAKYDSLSESEKDSRRDLCKAEADKLGLGEWGCDKTNRLTIEIPSSKYPKHLFKIGYFRSSYNEIGLDSVLRRLIGTELGELFGEDRSGEEMQPDWEAVKERLKSAIADLRAKITAVPYDAVRLENYTPHTEGPSDAATAIEIASKQLSADRKGGFGDSGWSCREGIYFPKGESFVGFIFGTYYSMPCVWGIITKENSDYNFHREALEICIETCDFVLKQPDPENFWLSWSR